MTEHQDRPNNGRVAGKVALVTGAGRGQGRSHAVRLAEEGADIIAVDVCTDIETMPYPMSTEEDLAETARQVRACGRRIVVCRADVRDLAAVTNAVETGTHTLGPVTIVVANAGIAFRGQPLWEVPAAEWNDVIAVNLTGVFHTIKAVVPGMLSAGLGGSIVLISSGAALKGAANIGEYVAAKSGVMGMARSLARSLGPSRIRVNTILPGSCNTDMIQADYVYRMFRPDLRDPTRADVLDAFKRATLLPVPWVEPVDVSNAVLFLASEEARYITGVALPVDAGAVLK